MVEVAVGSVVNRLVSSDGGIEGVRFKNGAWRERDGERDGEEEDEVEEEREK